MIKKLIVRSIGSFLDEVREIYEEGDVGFSIFWVVFWPALTVFFLGLIGIIIWAIVVFVIDSPIIGSIIMASVAIFVGLCYFLYYVAVGDLIKKDVNESCQQEQ